MFEVGKTYETKLNGAFKCIAVTDTNAWMKSGDTMTAYVWTHDGKSVSLSGEYDIKPNPREFWLDPDDLEVYGYPVPGAIHVREVMPE